MSESISDKELRALSDQVKSAFSSGTPLRIEGAGSKAFYGRAIAGETLSTTGLTGIVQYDPTELVVTAKAGTPIIELETLLAKQQQILAFEPPVIGERGTIGGMVASGLAGPARPWRGAVRDHILGIRMINGKGELLRFGGQVMKNVAGYDISRLMVGSMGCLGVLTEVSIKVLPKPKSVQFCRIEGDLEAILNFAKTRAKMMTPLSGISHDGHQGYLRMEGDNKVLDRFIKKYGLTRDETGQTYWQNLRHHASDIFGNSGLSDESNAETIWLLSLPKWSDASLDDLPFLMDWAGARYWVRGGERKRLQRIAKHFGGHLSRYRSGLGEKCKKDGEREESFSALSPTILRLHQSLKQAYDPRGIFNPGRLYAGL